MNYDDDILHVLREAGQEGLSIKKIVLHVYNRKHGLFDDISLDNVRQQVINFLLHHSKNTTSLIEHTEKRGVYRINLSSQECKQLYLNFKDLVEEKQPDETVNKQEDKPLSLF